MNGAIDTPPKIGNELPNTDAPERLGAALVVKTLPVQPLGCLPYSQRLTPIWVVDFYRGRPQ